MQPAVLLPAFLFPRIETIVAHMVNGEVFAPTAYDGEAGRGGFGDEGGGGF